MKKSSAKRAESKGPKREKSQKKASSKKGAAKPKPNRQESHKKASSKKGASKPKAHVLREKSPAWGTREAQEWLEEDSVERQIELPVVDGLMVPNEAQIAKMKYEGVIPLEEGETKEDVRWEF